MVDLIIVLALILAGIALIIVEILFVPGTTIVGIVGLVALAFGVYLSFEYFGSTIGWWVFSGAAIGFGVTVYYSFRSNAWDKFSLKDANSGKVNEGYVSKLQVAQRGITLSALRPFGKAEFNDKVYEVRSFGSYIDSGQKIEIVKIDGHQIYVEPLK